MPIRQKMSAHDSLIRDITDTARWVAVYRARESERPDAHFRDPFARRLAGERGEQIAGSMPFAEKNSWPFVARTWLIDRVIGELALKGADMVVNIAAGLDARPYRLDLPPALKWVEVDLPGIVEYKEQVLSLERPICSLERIKLDLSDANARRELFLRLGSRSKCAVIVAEGLLVYLSEDEVGALAQDLAGPAGFRYWLMDIASPALLRMLRKRMSGPLDRAGLPLRFSPDDGPEFFLRYGWKLEEVHSVIHAAAKLNRLPLLLRLIARISSPRFQANRPWSGVCLLARR